LQERLAILFFWVIVGTPMGGAVVFVVSFIVGLFMTATGKGAISWGITGGIVASILIAGLGILVAYYTAEASDHSSHP
jgi:ethanolamine transporter EutH